VSFLRTGLTFSNTLVGKLYEVRHLFPLSSRSPRIPPNTPPELGKQCIQNLNLPGFSDDNEIVDRCFSLIKPTPEYTPAFGADT
jgi:hypothetical protein